MSEDILNFKIINTKQGTNKNHLFFTGDRCLYKKNKVKGNVVYYKCIGKCEKNYELCVVTGKLENNKFSIIKRSAKHNHFDHSEKAHAQEVYNKMKEDITNTTEPVGKIISQNLDK